VEETDGDAQQVTHAAWRADALRGADQAVHLPRRQRSLSADLGAPLVEHTVGVEGGGGPEGGEQLEGAREESGHVRWYP
jgi:hypothetical protein